MKRRVVVTGLGAVTPLGNDVPTMWQSQLQCRNGVGPITHFDATRFPTKFAAEVRGY
ncbi:MAG: beta-ketoacyl synthase N-terminal-like domain-containing protein, partial [Planctomycetaceae bacterium]